MGYLRRMGARARRRLGRAVHDAGGATRADVRALQAEIQQLRDAVSAGGVGLDGLTAVVNNLGRARTDDLARLARIDVLLAVETFSRFIRHARLRTKPLVSVVLPTYNRPERLVRAIQSVAAQRYENWELIVVDDGGDTAWPATQVSDPRVRSLRLEHGGVCAARNAGLARARGEIIGYLDDDNVMDPDWLYAVVWAFERRPEVDVLYGAFVIDDVQRVTGGASSRELPRTFLHPWDRMALERGNLADIGAVAHRSGLAHARFDESLTQMGDWDLLLRLTADRDPLVLPAVACYYTTDAPGRLSLGPTAQTDKETVIAKAAVSKT